jgi:hypothetical protein
LHRDIASKTRLTSKPDPWCALKALEYGGFKATRRLQGARDDLDAAYPALSHGTAKRHGQFCVHAKLEQSLGFGFGGLISRQDTDAWHCRRPA